MIQLPNVQIHNNASSNFGAGFYSVQVAVPGEIGEIIGMACEEAKDCYFGGVATIAGETADINGYEFDGEGLLWADTRIGDIWVSAMRNADGSFLLSLTCEKIGCTDDYLDQYEFLRRMDNVLPDNFWIEPSKLIRKLITEAKIAH